MFLWDEGNDPHVRAHGITPEEVEEALTDPFASALPSVATVGAW